MRLALIQSFLPSRSQGGVGHFTHQYANRLVTRGHSVTVFSHDPRPDGAHYDVVTAMPRELVFPGKFGTTYGFAIWVARQDYRRFDLVHAMGDNHLMRPRVPVVRTISGAALAEALRAAKLSTRLMYLSIYPLEVMGVARANAAVGISRDSNRYFPWVHDVIPQGIDRQIFRGEAPRDGPPSILFVGHRFRDRKRAYLLFDAFQQVVRPALPEAELWLVCDDHVEAPGVRQVSNLSLSALAELYRRAWVFCLPSSYEGFGRPYAEALASATPVVATPNPGALEVLQDGACGLICPDTRLGETLVELLRDGSRRQALAQAGLRRAADFDWDTVAAQYEALYERVRATRSAV